MSIIEVAATITGFGGVLDRAKNFLRMHEEGRMSEAALAGAELAMERAEDEMRTAPEYKDWTHLPGSVRPSGRPWNYPAYQLGDLVDSFEATVIGSGKAAWDAGGPDAPHTWYMEFGTSKITPRPFMLITATKYRGEIQERIKDYIRHGATIYDYNSR